INFASASGGGARIPVGAGFVSLPAAGTFVIEVSSTDTGSYALTLAGPGTTYSVSGHVTSGSSGLAGVTMTFSVVAGTGALPGAVTTDSTGGWSQTGFEPGTVYRVTPSKAGYLFTPGFVDFNGAAGINFTATGITCSAFTVVPIAVGETKTGSLVAGDCTSPLNGPAYHADRYSFD